MKTKLNKKRWKTRKNVTNDQTKKWVNDERLEKYNKRNERINDERPEKYNKQSNKIKE